jgi:hypothetical protein
MRRTLQGAMHSQVDAPSGWPATPWEREGAGTGWWGGRYREGRRAKAVLNTSVHLLIVDVIISEARAGTHSSRAGGARGWGQSGVEQGYKETSQRGQGQETLLKKGQGDLKATELFVC